ncbi:cupin domain-containing protein [Oleiagrimonas sp. C23AA]|uniref:cupin domain-containing protein n=1 Tax=Oleiagrimonas sp. C23AA TaxID=2719047 RepID=UPI00141DCAF2|nr:cupin domain-containing protein [Oleiagrimonas sp. C23AA]NII09352.1 cupin domain-containing protein [Oleiagrimonas sp. C23AA]
MNDVLPHALQLAPGRDVPNHPRYPLLLYRQVLPVSTADLAAAFEARFRAHDWPAQWRAGIYPYHHYHASAHEAFGIAAGSARVRLGGEDGIDVELTAGDVLVLPAGTAHRGLEASADFVAVGAYPRGAGVDMHRAGGGMARQRAQIANVPHPGADPAYGAAGALMRLWPTSPDS